MTVVAPLFEAGAKYGSQTTCASKCVCLQKEAAAAKAVGTAEHGARSSGARRAGAGAGAAKRLAHEGGEGGSHAHVYEARGHEAPARVDLARPLPEAGPDGRDLPVADAHIGVEGRGSGPIHDGATTHHEIVLVAARHRGGHYRVGGRA